MELNFNGKTITINKQDVDALGKIPGGLDTSAVFLLGNPIYDAYYEYMSTLSRLCRLVSEGENVAAQNEVNRLSKFDEFLSQEITVKGTTKTVCAFIYENIGGIGTKAELDTFFGNINRIFGFDIKPAELGVSQTGLIGSFDKAIRDWKSVAHSASAHLQEIYSFGDFLKDAFSKGLNKDTDLPFLKSAYNTFERYGDEDVMMYLKDFVKGKKKTGEDIIRFVADFAQANHMNNEEFIPDEAEIVKKYNAAFKELRPAMKVPEFDNTDTSPDRNRFFSSTRLTPVKILNCLKVVYPMSNNVYKTQLPMEARQEAYVAITGKNDGEIKRLREMFGTGKGLFGGFNTEEYERVREALDKYIQTRESLQNKTKDLVAGKNIEDYFNEKGLGIADFMKISEKRKRLEKALTEYIVKKTKGSDNQIGDVKIEDKTGYGAARLSSAMLLLDIIREEKGGPMKTSDRRKEYTVSATDFKKLYDAEKKKKNAGGRRKSSERAIEEYKENRKQRNAGEKGAAKKPGPKKKPVV